MFAARTRRRARAAGIAAVLLGLAACASPATPRPSTTSAPADLVQARTPGQAVTVIADDDRVARAVAASRTLFAASSGVVLVRDGDVAATTRGAAEAARLHVPMLPVPGAGTDLEAVRTEAARLHARWAVRVGAVPATAVPGLRSADSARPVPAVRRTGTVAVALLGDAAADAAAAATARAAGSVVVPLSGDDCDLARSPAAVAALAAHPAAPAVLIGAGFAQAPPVTWSVAAARSGFRWPGGGQRPLPGHRFVALYGVPGVPVLGALGDQGIAASIARVRGLAAQYRPLSSEPVVPTLEIIATVAAGAPGQDHDYSNELDPASLKPWVDAARRAGVAVILDLQPGRADFPSQAKRYAALLEQPNVGLALDPEWRLSATQVPLRQIGSVGAAEVNRTSAWLADLVESHHLPPKLFVLHQFRPSMLPDRSRIVQRPELDTVVHVDGQGGQPDKQATWRAIREGAPAGIGWGWKNFLHKDHPMLTPQQTMRNVHPAPDLITYQ